DLNPLSVLVARTKTALLEVSAEELSSFVEYVLYTLETGEIGTLSSSLCDRWDEHDLKYLHKWFDEVALAEIHQVLQAIDACGHKIIFDFLRLCLSNILRSASWQKEDDLRVRKEKTTYELGTVGKLFKEEVSRQVD